MNRATIIAVMVATVFSTHLDSVALAWGNDGHRIVGEIAWQQLTPTTRAAVRELLPNGRYGRLYEAATWPDTYARLYSRYDWVKPLHYVEIAPDLDEIDVPDDCKCVISAIDQFSAQLIDENERYDYRVNALRFVAHFVGDIHQPLHVGHPDGIGGNATNVHFDGRWTNIHKVWDTTLIAHHLEHTSAPPSRDPWEPEPEFPEINELDWEAYALNLLNEITEADILEWTRDLDPENWASESRGYAKTHIYQVAAGTRLDSTYYQNSMPVISLRLKQAGVRLGSVLNKLFDP